jgi:hypothetical protein
MIQTTALTMKTKAEHAGDEKHLTTMDDLSVELLYEVLTYLQLHEILQNFSDLNRHITAILSRMKLLRVLFDLSGKSMSLIHF